jgi:nicotinamidase-related amidase
LVRQDLKEEAMEIRPNDTALVVIDPQNDFLSPKGVTWGLVGESVQKNRTVEHIEQLFKKAKANDYDVFISPHYYYPTDHGWKFGGTVEKMMHEIKMFDRGGTLSLDGFRGSGADWLEQYKPYIEDRKTIITSPHKVYGPESNDLALQLRKRGKSKVLLAGMSANLCVEAHLRELLEQGFEVAVIKDATAAAIHPELGDGYTSAITNFGFIANAVLTTADTIEAMEAGSTKRAA